MELTILELLNAHLVYKINDGDHESIDQLTSFWVENMRAERKKERLKK